MNGHGQYLRHDLHPVHLGVTLDRNLLYSEHLTHSAAKLKSCNNLITELSGISLGAGASMSDHQVSLGKFLTPMCLCHHAV